MDSGFEKLQKKLDEKIDKKHANLAKTEYEIEVGSAFADANRTDSDLSEIGRDVQSEADKSADEIAKGIHNLEVIRKHFNTGTEDN